MVTQRRTLADEALTENKLLTCVSPGSKIGGGVPAVESPYFCSFLLSFLPRKLQQSVVRLEDGAALSFL